MRSKPGGKDSLLYLEGWQPGGESGGGKTLVQRPTPLLTVSG